MTTKELLSETVDAARLRECALFERLFADSGGNIVLFGAGRLGRKTAAALTQRGFKPLAFVDNDTKLDGTRVDGIPVSSPAALSDRLSDGALFVITIFLPTGGGVHSRQQELEALGCRKIASFLPLGWKLDGMLPHFGSDLPSRLLVHAKELAFVAELLGDELSRETFGRELSWRLRADFSSIIQPEPDQYFPRDIISPNPRESFVDGGAFDGDTLRSAPWHFANTLAIEPDPVNAARLRSFAGQGIEVREVILGRTSGSARFNGSGTMASSRSEGGSLQISVATLDDLTAGAQPTFIKLDIEGDELAALQGGRKMLENSQPVVAACVYHRPDDLWMIPLYLHEALPNHRIFLRAHAWDGFELVAYAVPPERCLSIQ